MKATKRSLVFRHLSLLGLLALFSFATSPAGFMPAFGAHGPVLVICPQSTDLGDLVHLPAGAQSDDAHAGHHMPDHDGVDDAAGGTSSTCDYGMPAHADQPGSVDFAAPLLAAEGIETPTSNPLTTIFPPSMPPATGPPAFS